MNELAANLAKTADCGPTRCGRSVPSWERSRQPELAESRGRQAAGRTRENPAPRSATLSPRAARGGKLQYAVLVLPGSRLPPASAPALRAFQANARLTWYAVTPLVLELREGVVQRADLDVQATLEGETRPSMKERKRCWLRRSPSSSRCWWR